MLVVYLKNYSTIFRVQAFSLHVILAKQEDWSKAQIVNILAWRGKNKGALFSAASLICLNSTSNVGSGTPQTKPDTGPFNISLNF